MIIRQFALVILVIFSGVSAQAQDLVLLHGEEVSPNRVLVKVRPGVAAEAFDLHISILHAEVTLANRVMTAHGVDRLRPLHAEGFADPALAAQLGMDRTYVADLAPGEDLGVAINALRARGDLFEFIEPDGVSRTLVSPDDQFYASHQWALRNTGQFIEGYYAGTPGIDINTETAWNITTGDSNVRIAILDTGLDSAHPDINIDRVVAGRQFVDGLGINDWTDRHGHGTAVTGIAAAQSNNGIGIAGVCWDCSLIITRMVNDAGLSYDNWIAESIRWSTDQGSNVINMSFGRGGSPNPAVSDAVNYAWGQGVVLVAGSGNTGTQQNFWPASFEKVIAVGATNSNDILAAFSTTGPQLDLTAPGVLIASTYLNGGLFGGLPPKYGLFGGTSAASPHVAGVAALILSRYPDLEPEEVRELLRSSAVDLGEPGKDNLFGYGRINAGQALIDANPCPADLDGDGSVNIFDLFEYLSNFANGDPSADLAPPFGTFNVFDVFAYLNLYQTGCP